MFLIDLLSSIPIDLLFPNSPLKTINILKIIRIKRLTRIIDKMNADEERKSIYRMLQLVFYLFLMMHVVGCLWNSIIHIEEIWVITKDFYLAGQYPKVYRFLDTGD
jgi:hypothetical protein